MPRPGFYSLDEKKRQAILQGGEEEFARHGFPAASYNRIMERLGISKGSMYHYFEDKADLYRTVMEGVFEKIEAIIWADEVDASTEETYWQSVRDIFNRGMELMFSEPRTLSLYKGLVRSKSEPGGNHLFAELVRRFSAWEHRFLSAGVAAGYVRGDLPIDLQVKLMAAIGEAFDNFMLGEQDRFQSETEEFERVREVVDWQFALVRQVFAAP